MPRLVANRIDGTRYILTRAIVNRIRRVNGRLRRLLCRPVAPRQIELYKLMKRDNVNAPSLYHADEYAAGYNRRILDYVYAGSLQDLRNSPVSRWFSGPPPMSRGIYQSLL